VSLAIPTLTNFSPDGLTHTIDGRDEFLAVNVSPESTCTYTHTHYDAGQFRLYVSVYVRVRGTSNVRTSDTVSITCYLPVSQIYIYGNGT